MGENNPATNPAPAPAQKSALDGVDFMADIKKSMSVQKQQYGNIPTASATSASGAEATRAPDGTPLTSTNDPGASSAPNQINMDPYDQLKKEAAIWVFGIDLAASRGLKFYSKIGSVDDYKLSDSEKTDLTTALADYFATLPQTPKMPPWVVLLITVAMIYGGKALAAHGKRMESKRKKKVVPDVSAPTANESNENTKSDAGKVIKMDRRPRKQSTGKKKADRKPKYDPSKPYWDQQWSSKGIRILNPIDANENERRKLNGGAICLNCQTNYAKPGKNACSTHCNGKLNKKSNVSS